MNTVFFHRGPKRTNAVMFLFESARRSNGRQHPAPVAEPPAKPSLGQAPRTEPAADIQEAAERLRILHLLLTRHLGLPVEGMGQDQSLETPGFHPLSLQHLAAAIDLELGVEVPLGAAHGGITLGDLARMVAPVRA
jgi:hypothetical protein